VEGEMSQFKLVSACLIGIDCAYHGSSNHFPDLIGYLKDWILVPICPEQLGGLPTPRDRACIVGEHPEADGNDVLEGRAKVLTLKGMDVTRAYLKGGQESLKIAKILGAKEAILKEKSPSCGCGEIFTENFNTTKSGDGATTALFKKNGITVCTGLDYVTKISGT
jgi:uncharacterized protein YbbK (DUF523 family)